jgi:outer membrane immunogenic protein
VRNLLTAVFAAAFSVALTAIASAAHNWTGLYAGVNAGGAWGSSDANTSTVYSNSGTSYFTRDAIPAIAAVGAQHINSSGAVAGAQIGYNWQVNNLLLGIETDFQYYGLKGSSTASGIYPCCAPSAFTINSSVQSDWLFTARPRIGWAVQDWLIYATGGLAVGEVNGNFSFSDNFAAASESASLLVTKTGWTAGTGVEYGALGPWTVKLEYLHVDLGTASVNSSNLATPAFTFPMNPFTHSVDLRSDMVRIGLNYHFE